MPYVSTVTCPAGEYTKDIPLGVGQTVVLNLKWISAAADFIFVVRKENSPH